MAASQELLSTKGMFDSIGPAYEEAFAGLKTQLNSIQWVLTQVQDRRPALILDLGCGTGGPVCETFAEAGHDVLGADVSGVMLQDARAKVADAKFLKADAFQIDLPPGRLRCHHGLLQHGNQAGPGPNQAADS